MTLLKRHAFLIAMLALAASTHAQKLTDQMAEKQRIEAGKSAYEIQREKNQAAYKKAKELIAAGNESGAIPYIQAASDGGDEEATLDLAMRYEEGNGVRQSLRKAQQMYVSYSGRNSSDAVARIKVASIYCGTESLYTDDPVILNPQKGLEALTGLYERRLSAQIQWLQYVCYARSSDPAHAKKAKEALDRVNSLLGRDGEHNTQWNRAAWQQARKEIWTCSPHVQSDGPCQQFALMDKTGAIMRHGAAAEAGDVMAQRALYEAYSDGRGAPPDRTKAFEWINKAAEAGDAYAQTIVGEAYLNGYTPVERSPQAAISWLKKGADGGQWMAAYMLSGMYRDGLAGKVDQKQAQAWFARCAALDGQFCKGKDASKASDSALQRAFQK